MEEIVLYPNEVLRRGTLRVEVVDRELKTELINLKKILLAQVNGAGLAAPQIGISKRFFGLKLGKKKEVKLLINPEILGVYGKKDWIKITGEKVEGEDKVKDEDFLEGCLSFPNLFGTVKRWVKIRAKWQELKRGKLVEVIKEMVGFEAIVFQHELDHLEGILFIDHIKKDGGKLYRQVGEKMTEESLANFVE